MGERRWVLVCPDPDRAGLHVYVEAPTAAEADAFLSEQVGWVKSLIEEESR